MNPANYLIPILEMYCAWLNCWTATDVRPGDPENGPHPDEVPHRYTIHSFMVHDPSKKLYGESRVCGVIPDTMGGHTVIVMVSDGDDGGPSELTAYFRLNDDNTATIQDLIQGFDTSRQFIVHDGVLVNLP